MQVVNFERKLPATCTAREQVTMNAFPESLTAQGMLGRWKRSAKLRCWHLVPVDIATRVKEIPNWLKSSLQLQGRKGKPEDHVLPMELMVEYDKVLNSRVNGLTKQSDIREALRRKNIVIGMSSLINRYNKRVALMNVKIDEKNTKLYNEWKEGNVNAQQAKDREFESASCIDRTKSRQLQQTK